METIILKIDGMHCTGCSNRLERLLNDLVGIEKVIVSYEQKEAHITYDIDQISIQKIREAIIDAGFEVSGE